MQGFTSPVPTAGPAGLLRDGRRLYWIIAAPGAASIDWDCIVSEDEDGVRSGWAYQAAANDQDFPAADMIPRRAARPLRVVR